MAREPGQATARPEVPEGMAVYYLGLLLRGPAWTAEQTPEVERLQAAHQAHLRRLRESGKLVIMGPLLDDGQIRGVSVFRVDSPEEALALMTSDPAVQAGRLVCEVHPWMAPRGILP